MTQQAARGPCCHVLSQQNCAPMCFHYSAESVHARTIYCFTYCVVIADLAAQAYVTGLEAANLVVQHCGQGLPAHVIPLEPEEGHVTFARGLVRSAQTLQQLNPLNALFPSVVG